MTTKTKAASVADLTAKLARIAAELDEARQDVALLERLKGAQDRAKTLTADLDRTIAERKTALAAAEKAREAERFKNLSDIRVTDAKPGEGLLRSAFTINYTRKAWDMYANENVPQRQSVAGFGSLPDEVLDFLIERHPEEIPTKIRALADDPREAFNVYFRALRRGYLSP